MRFVAIHASIPNLSWIWVHDTRLFTLMHKLKIYFFCKAQQNNTLILKISLSKFFAEKHWKVGKQKKMLHYLVQNLFLRLFHKKTAMSWIGGQYTFSQSFSFQGEICVNIFWILMLGFKYLLSPQRISSTQLNSIFLVWVKSILYWLCQ